MHKWWDGQCLVITPEGEKFPRVVGALELEEVDGRFETTVFVHRLPRLDKPEDAAWCDAAQAELLSEFSKKVTCLKYRLGSYETPLIQYGAEAKAG